MKSINEAFKYIVKSSLHHARTSQRANEGYEHSVFMEAEYMLHTIGATYGYSKEEVNNYVNEIAPVFIPKGIFSNEPAVKTVATFVTCRWCEKKFKTEEHLEAHGGACEKCDHDISFGSDEARDQADFEASLQSNDPSYE